MAESEPATFGFRAKPRLERANDLEYNDFKRWGYDVDGDNGSPYVILNRYRKQSTIPKVFMDIIEKFGFNYPTGNGAPMPNFKFDCQMPGQLFYLHIDNFAGLLKKQRDNYNKPASCDYDQRKLMRIIIFLDDHKVGQVWRQGNEYIEWKKGDCITWPWRDIPHGTANFSHYPRPTLNITGEVTTKTLEFLKSIKHGGEEPSISAGVAEATC